MRALCDINSELDSASHLNTKQLRVSNFCLSKKYESLEKDHQSLSLSLQNSLNENQVRLNMRF
jgi:hypothetical protein